MPIKTTTQPNTTLVDIFSSRNIYPHRIPKTGRK
jgi:hypothetical protein